MSSSRALGTLVRELPPSACEQIEGPNIIGAVILQLASESYQLLSD